MGQRFGQLPAWGANCVSSPLHAWCSTTNEYLMDGNTKAVTNKLEQELSNDCLYDNIYLSKELESSQLKYTTVRLETSIFWCIMYFCVYYRLWFDMLAAMYAIWVTQWRYGHSVVLLIERSRVRLPLRHCCATTLGKLFTPLCLSLIHISEPTRPY